MDIQFYLPCVYSFFACIGFCFLFNVHKLDMFVCSLGGALGWLVYLLFDYQHNDIWQSLLATIFVSIYAEILARIMKKPVTLFLIIGILPLVPGNGIYRAMEFCINGDNEQFLSTSIHTLAVAGALAVGILLVSSIVHLINQVKNLNKTRKVR